MDCTKVAAHLVAYHLGTAFDDDRDAVEAHLLGCRSCLETFLALKRATEKRKTGEELAPSPATRARLRAEVARTFATEPAPKVRLFARRIPLYQGLAAAAIAAAISLAAPSVIERFAKRDVGNGAPEVDSSRSRAASLLIY
jgi:hypothetical protein